jgi:hypothetical protein
MEVDLPADTIIDAYADWVHVDRYLPCEFPFRFERIEYAPGSGPNKYPCTRYMFLDRSTLSAEMQAQLPEFFSETVYSVDREAGTINYSVDKIGPFGSRNYFACTTVDPLEGNASRVTTNSRFDLPRGASLAEYCGMLETLYRWQVTGIAQWAKSSR